MPKDVIYHFNSRCLHVRVAAGKPFSILVKVFHGKGDARMSERHTQYGNHAQQ